MALDRCEKRVHRCARPDEVGAENVRSQGQHRFAAYLEWL